MTQNSDICPWCVTGDGRDKGTAAVQDAWKDTAFAWLLGLPLGSVVTADDLRASVGDPAKPAAVGAAFRAAALAGIISLAGFAPSGRRTNHSRILRRWTRVEPSEG